MLHEILLSLSGISSPIWKEVKNNELSQKDGLQDYVTPPEHAMLKVLAHLSELHIEVKEHCTNILASQASIICRTVASSILTLHLARFRQRVLEVESLILQKDAGFVGSYQIVPLSTIVSEFAPWTRRLEWLRTVVGYLQPNTSSGKTKISCSGPAILNFLRKESYTGYSDIEDMANELSIEGQKVWMRIAASWILYGKLQASAFHDFFVHQPSGAATKDDEFTADGSLLPHFVNSNTADSILSIGYALNQLRSHERGKSHRQGDPAGDQRWVDPALGLLRGHLELLESLSYPLHPAVLGKVVLQINQSISKNALSQLLPKHQVAAFLRVIWYFVLLGRGEFATSLISSADERVASRQRDQNVAQPVRKSGRLDGLTIKETELTAVLSKTWSELESIQTDDDPQDEHITMARKVLRLVESTEEDQIPISTFLPTTAVLKLIHPQNSALSLFAGQREIRLYSAISAYLLSLRRAELHLAQLWKLTGHRRCYPTPVGPPTSSTKVGQQALISRREREAKRSRAMRQHWACSSKALFVLNELDEYIHGEVIQKSWAVFSHWLEGRDGRRPSSSKSQMSRPTTASSNAMPANSHRISQGDNVDAMPETDRHHAAPSDPRTLATAHRKYLESLYNGLLLKNNRFISILKGMLGTIDHYVALFSRLQTAWQGLDLQEDDGVMDAFSNYTQDEKDVLAEMGRTRLGLEDLLGSLVDTLKETGLKDSGAGEISLKMMQVDLEHHGFEPWKARTVDRLIMKLDCLSGHQATNDSSAGAGWNLGDEG